MGILLLLANGVLFWSNARRMLQSKNDAWLLVTGVLGSGVTFLNWSIHRSEGWLLFALQSSVAILLTRRARNDRREWWTLPAACSLGLLAISIHPNSLYLAPLFFLVTWSTSARWHFKLVASTILLFAYSNILQYSDVLLRCEQNPVLGVMLRQYVTSPAQFLEDPSQFMKSMVANGSAVLVYFQSLLYRAAYPYSWLPAEKLTEFPVFMNIAAVLIWTGLIGMLVKRLEFRSRPIQWALAVTLGFAVCSIVFLQKEKLFYSSQLAVPLVFYVLMAAQKPRTEVQRSSLEPRMIVVALCAFLNAFWLQLHTATADVWSADRLIRATRGTLSMVVPDYQQVNRDLDELMNRCELPMDDALPGLVVDDLTYWRFRKSPRLMHSFYLFRSTYGRTIKALPPFLEAYQSSGVVVRCWELAWQPELYRRAVQHRGLCCINLKGK